MLELSARLQNTWQCIFSDWKTLEPSTNLQANFGLEGILSKHFFVQKMALKFKLLFHCLQLQHVTVPNYHAHVRIRPIVRHIRNP